MAQLMAKVSGSPVDLKQKLTAEFLGTFALVFFGTGAIITNEVTGGDVTHVGIAVTFGLVVLAMIYSFGEISGAHINPAVSIAFWAAGKFEGKHVVPYCIVQTIAAICASFLLLAMFPESESLGATRPNGSILRCFVLEFILTYFLMIVIINVSTGSKETGLMAGIAIGATVLIEAMWAGPITGASMNPARSIGPDLATGNMNTLWIYVAAPIAGALGAIYSCRLYKGTDCC